MRVIGIYVTYYPDLELFKRSLEITSKLVNEILIINNTEDKVKNKVLENLIINFSNCELVSFYENKGIAYALNAGCKLAIVKDYKWAITFDQDSIPSPEFIITYQQNLSKYDYTLIGILCPLYKMDDNDKCILSNTIEEVTSSITSGSMMNLKAYEKVGGFKDFLFIDSVDTEYSWNLRKNGFKILRINSLLLEHHLGVNPKNINIFGHRLMTITNHNYIRCYYITRNSLIISKMYKNIFPKECKKYKKGVKLLIKVLIFEKDKLRKIRSILLGYLDFYNHKYGKYSH